MTMSDDPRKTFSERQQQLLHYYELPARSRYVDLARPAMRVHLLEAGGGEPFLFLHGGDGEAALWAPLMAAMQDDGHLYALDRPGCGLSDPFDYRRVGLRAHSGDVVTSVLDALGLESATLVATSMGGFFALATALDHPERVRRLVLVGMAVGLSRTVSIPLRLLGGVPGLSRRFMATRASLKAQRAQYEKLFHIRPESIPEPYLEARVAGVAIPATRETWAVLLRRVAGLRGMRPEVHLGAELERVQAPTLVLWGEHDMAPLEAGRQETARIPGARFVPMMGLGHHPFLEAPEDTARHVRDFVRATAAADAAVPGPSGVVAHTPTT